MKIHRFFIAQQVPKDGEIIISDGSLLNQWRNVLRMKAGDKVTVFDGSGEEALCELRALDKKSASLLVLEKKKGFAPEREITLFMSLIKRDNFELVLEKATELGVTRIVPVEASHNEKKGLNRERSEKILREASEQSGRATVPGLGEIIDIKNIPVDTLVVFDPCGKKFAREFFTTNATVPRSILIGPEGGFTDEEIEFFKTKGAPIFTLGKAILRAETAAIVVLAIIMK
ncbi:MAG: 16S rRNA (uracil(1498)-N(3))-methyltransferase [Candidatus Yonathbacteria bacterium]|nr:16S rRNA (uracil(1498)-N(3))-methyltransferase [Candidatus Yonathbacteria bacterium]